MIHWLQIGGIKHSLKNEFSQWQNLKEYSEKYPNSKITVYNKNTGDMFAKIIKLECGQNYNDLDLDCNSMFNGSIKHLNYKPNNIELCKVQSDYYFNKLETKTNKEFILTVQCPAEEAKEEIKVYDV